MPSPRPSGPRPFDIVVFGATGFVGRMAAEYLARHAPADCTWALAGRTESKLAQVRESLTEIDPALADLALILADVTDAPSLRELAQSTRVLITTVGPYVLYGHELVAACATAGTDYLDLTGEPEFVNATYVRQHQRAVASGARLIHSAGFDSLPHDLGAFFTVNQLPENVPITVSGYVRVSAAFSGGTYYSAITAMGRPQQNLSTARARKAAEPLGERSARVVTGHPHRDPVDGGWVVPLPTLDPQVVTHSARALPRYGPDFRYSHFANVGHLHTVVGAAAGLGVIFGLAQIPPVRKVLLRRIAPGDGPSAEKRARSWFTVTFVGEGGGQRIVTRVSGGDPGYDETAKMLAESALCLAFDELPATSGQVTTAQAMGQPLLERLQRAGITFEVLDR